MDIFVFISRFIYRIRYKLLIGTAIATILAIYLTSFLPKRYTSTTTIFTGITSSSSLSDQEGNVDWNTSNNAHDNIINLIKSKSTLEKISTCLLAQHLIYGDPNKDNKYITADHYRKLMLIVPKEVLKLVEKGSYENTVNNLINYRTENRNNFMYGLFNYTHPHYSYQALKEIKVKRQATSDMIEISYESNDPGIASNTVRLLNVELEARYEGLLLSASHDVVKYFEEQLRLAAIKLTQTEDDLVKFNVDHKIINYEEQTKHLAALNNNFESRFEEILLMNRSSKALLTELEDQMLTNTKLVRENEVFLNTLAEISEINGKVAEIEIFGASTKNNNQLLEYKNQLATAEQKIKEITLNMDTYRYSKEGIVITDMVTEWLKELLNQEKTKAELEIMVRRKKEIEGQYAFFSPVGPNLSRKDREVKVAEEQYLTLLHHLGLAKLKQKNILLNTGTLQIVTPPELPLLSKPRNRGFFVIAAFILAFIFICGIQLLVELLDRTLRDAQRAEKLTKAKVLGVFPMNQRLKYRGYDNEVRHIATAYLANSLNKYIETDKTSIINLLSIEEGEGKSFISTELQQYWKEMGFSVKYIQYDKDFNTESREYIKTNSIYQLAKTPIEKTDIILVEYAHLKLSSVPTQLLQEATINLLITSANRMWKINDQVLLNCLQKDVGDKPLFLYLNNADREAVEEFTGQLPPYSLIRNLSYRLFGLGITAKKN